MTVPVGMLRSIYRNAFRRVPDRPGDCAITHGRAAGTLDAWFANERWPATRPCENYPGRRNGIRSVAFAIQSARFVDKPVLNVGKMQLAVRSRWLDCVVVELSPLIEQQA